MWVREASCSGSHNRRKRQTWACGQCDKTGQSSPLDFLPAKPRPRAVKPAMTVVVCLQQEWSWIKGSAFFQNFTKFTAGVFQTLAYFNFFFLLKCTIQGFSPLWCHKKHWYLSQVSVSRPSQVISTRMWVQLRAAFFLSPSKHDEPTKHQLWEKNNTVNNEHSNWAGSMSYPVAPEIWTNYSTGVRDKISEKAFCGALA